MLSFVITLHELGQDVLEEYGVPRDWSFGIECIFLQFTFCSMSPYNLHVKFLKLIFFCLLKLSRCNPKES